MWIKTILRVKVTDNNKVTLTEQEAMLNFDLVVSFVENKEDGGVELKIVNEDKMFHILEPTYEELVCTV